VVTDDWFYLMGEDVTYVILVLIELSHEICTLGGGGQGGGNPNEKLTLLINSSVFRLI